MFPKLLDLHGGLRGTMFYLFRVGGSTVHVDPHIVAAWDEDLALGQAARPGQDGIVELVHRLDAPRVLREIHVETGHVLHVPISVHADDGLRGDAEWAGHARELVDRLGLARCRWVAVHHGPNKNGNDHIHLVVQLVDEDGKLARLPYSKRKARAWAQEVEDRLDLVRTGKEGRGARGLSRAEYDRAAATGVQAQRRTIERKVRAAAAAAQDEFDFIARTTAAGLSVHGRVADGRVVGWSTELDAVVDGEPRLRFGGGSLARDLSLGRLRQRWPAAPATTAFEQVVLTAWSLPGLLTQTQAPTTWITDDYVRDLRQILLDLDTLDPGDVRAWNAAVDQAADLAAVLAVRFDNNGQGGVRAAADHLAAAARLGRPDRAPTSRSIVLPTLMDLTRALAYARTTDATALLAVLALVAVLVLVLAERQRHDQRPGQSGAHLRAAARCLDPFRARPAPPQPAKAATRTPTRRTPLSGERSGAFRPVPPTTRGRSR